MGQNAGRRAPTFSVFFDGRQARAVWSRRYVPRKLEQRRIPAKNAATRHLNAMGIAPKVVGASFLQPLTLMFRTNAPHTASQIPWVMQYAEQFTLIQELTPGASISASERGFSARRSRSGDTFTFRSSSSTSTPSNVSISPSCQLCFSSPSNSALYSVLGRHESCR